MHHAAPDVTEPHLLHEADTLELPRGLVFDSPDLDPAVVVLARELTHTTAMLADVAGILGACVHCFGIDRACSHCAGHGSPGWRDSAEPALLEYWLRNMGRPRVRKPPR